MGTGRKFSKTHMTRPRKGIADRRKRQNTQRKRLVSLGLSEETVAKMNSGEVRKAVGHPAKIKAES